MSIKNTTKNDGQTHLKVLRNLNRQRFTVIDNESVRDKSLSFKARGILLLLLSMDDGWHVTIERVAKLSREGVESVSSGMNELVAAGYLVRSNERNERGHFSWKMTVIESPSKNTTPQVDFPRMDFPCPDNHVFNRNKNTPHRKNPKEITNLSYSLTPQENPRARGESFQDPDSATHIRSPKPKSVPHGIPNQLENAQSQEALGLNPDATVKRGRGRPRKALVASDAKNAVEALESPQNGLQRHLPCDTQPGLSSDYSQVISNPLPNLVPGTSIQTEKQVGDGDPDKVLHSSLLSKSVADTEGLGVGETIDNLNQTIYGGSCENDTYLPIGHDPVEIDFMDAHEQIEGLPRAAKPRTAKLNTTPSAKLINSENNSDPFAEPDYGTIAKPVMPDWKRVYGATRDSVKREEGKATLALIEANPHWEKAAVRSALAGYNPEKGHPYFLAAWKIRSWGDGQSKVPLAPPSESDLPQLRIPMPEDMLSEIGEEAEFYYRWALKVLREEGAMLGFPAISSRAKELWSKVNMVPYPGT